MTNPKLDAITRFVGATPHRTLAPEVDELARQCLVDWFAVSLAALPDRGPMAARRQMRQWATRGNAMSLYGDMGAAAPMAMVNATLSHSIDFDDMHFASAFHASGPTLAAALAVGMDRGCSEREILDAFVTGFEVGATLGSAGIGPRLLAAGWHVTGILGHYASACATAALLRLEPPQIADALGLASTQAAGLQASSGTMAKPFHVGKAAMNGVMAAELAALGMDATPTLIDDENRGLLACLFQDAVSANVEGLGLGREWQIEQNTFKPYAACQLTHAPYEAAYGMRAGFRLQGLREIRISVNPLAPKVAGRMSATSPLEGKFCIGFCSALGLLGYRADMSGFSEARIQDPALQGLVARTRLITSDAIERCAARVELDYGDGVLVRGETTAVKGSPGRPLSWSDLDEKFLGATEPILGSKATPLLEALHHFDAPGTLDTIRRLLGDVRVPLA